MGELKSIPELAVNREDKQLNCALEQMGLPAYPSAVEDRPRYRARLAQLDRRLQDIAEHGSCGAEKVRGIWDLRSVLAEAQVLLCEDVDEAIVKEKWVDLAVRYTRTRLQLLPSS